MVGGSAKVWGFGKHLTDSEQIRFRSGHVTAKKTNPEIVKKVHRKRNLTIKRNRIRIKYNLPRRTKLNLK